MKIFTLLFSFCIFLNSCSDSKCIKAPDEDRYEIVDENKEEIDLDDENPETIDEKSEEIVLDDDSNTAEAFHEDISTDDAKNLIAENIDNVDFVILDVRTPEECESDGKIPGTVNIDFRSDSFEAEIEKLDRNLTYLIYCRSGGRSAMASDKMEELGFTYLYNMLGGITEWKIKEYETIACGE